MRRRLYLVAMLLVTQPCSVDAIAGERGPLAPLDMTSPKASLQSFLDEARRFEDLYADYRAGKNANKAKKIMMQVESLRTMFDLSQVSPALSIKVGGFSIFATMDILWRLPEIDLDSAPGGPDFDPETGPDFWTIPNTEISLQKLTEGSRKNTYRFSSETVDRLPEFHARIIDHRTLQRTAITNWHEVQVRFTGPWFSENFVKAIPDSLHPTLFGTPRWKVLLAIVTLLLLFSFNLIWGIVIRRLRGTTPSIGGLILSLTKPALLAGSYWLFHVFVNLQVNLQGLFAEGEFLLYSLVMYSSAAWVVWLLSQLAARLFVTSSAVSPLGFDAQFYQLLGRLVGLFGIAIVVVYAANEVGIPLIGLVTGLGIGGFALALAAKPTIENLFGGMNLFADRPFRVGDYIVYGDSFGRVEAIGPRSCRIRGLDDTVTTVPNGELAVMHITNFTDRNRFYFHHILALRYETSRAQFEWLLSELRFRIGADPMVEENTGFPRVRMVEFGTSSIDVDIRAYVLTSDIGEFMEVQERLILVIMKAVEEAGTGFAFPSQTTYFARDHGIDVDRVLESQRQDRGQLRQHDSIVTDVDGREEQDDLN